MEVQFNLARIANKTENVELLLRRGEFGARDIADIVGCSRQWVTSVRRRMRVIHVGMTVEEKVERLSQDVRDLRKFALHQQAILDQLIGQVTTAA